MAWKISDIVMQTCGDMEEKQAVLAFFISEEILTGHDLSSLLEGEVSEAFVAHLRPLAVEAWAIARKFKDSYWKIPSVAAGFCLANVPTGPVPSAASSGSVPIVPPSSKVPSVTSAKRCFLSFTRRSALGKIPVRHKRQGTKSLADVESESILRSVTRTHDIFRREAGDTPRMRAIPSDNVLLNKMQLDVYKLGSRSYKVIGTRPKMAADFFDDLKALKWSLCDLTPFMIAAWVRGRVGGCSKSASRRARTTLTLVSAATDIDLYINNSLVKSQLASFESGASHEEAPVAAKNFDPDVIIMMESWVMAAATPQQRCFLGFFCLLASSSLRASDALRTREISIIGDSLSGVSRLKAKKTWTKWFTPKMGFSGKDWTTPWVQELLASELPGTDFLLKGVNSACDAWCERPATYADARRVLHLVLMAYCGHSAEEAVEFNPHSFRHLMVTAGQQLAKFGVVKESDLDTVGHWARGSAMPRKYDAQAGVSEICTRESILQQLRLGWRPASEGSLPPPPIPSSSSPSSSSTSFVAHRKRKKVHVVEAGASRTRCKFWTCGTVDSPNKDAIFGDIDMDWQRCAPCG